MKIIHLNIAFSKFSFLNYFNKTDSISGWVCISGNFYYKIIIGKPTQVSLYFNKYNFYTFFNIWILTISAKKISLSLKQIEHQA